MKKEREAVERENVFWKALVLVTPDRANTLGIYAESPVFISPQIRQKEECKTCRVSYTPLTYQVGYMIKAQHFHEGESGGIYFNCNTESEFRALLAPPFFDSWVAICDVTGKSVLASRSVVAGVMVRGHITLMHADAARVRQILALCTAEQLSNHSPLGVKEGYLYSEDNEYLWPICDRHVSLGKPAISVRWRFQISDTGEVHFSKI